MEVTPRYKGRIKGCCDTQFGAQQELVYSWFLWFPHLSMHDLCLPILWGFEIGLLMRCGCG